MGEGSCLAETTRASAPLPGPGFLGNKVPAEGQPPFTRDLLEFLQGQPLPVASSSPRGLGGNTEAPFFMDDAYARVPEGLRPPRDLLPLPFSPLEHAPEGNMVPLLPFPATPFYSLQTRLSISKSLIRARHCEHVRCMASFVPHSSSEAYQPCALVSAPSLS